MCRIFGSVAPTAVSVRHELIEAPNPIIRQSESHDSGWGVAAYSNEGSSPRLVRFAHAAYADPAFDRATELRARIFNVHVRRATIGGLTLENTHPFTLGDISFSHNGTILGYPKLVTAGARPAVGETDSEVFFNLFLALYDPADIPGSLRRAARTVIDHEVVFSGLNALVSDGERLYACRLGVFELHWTVREAQTLVASEPITDEVWHTVRQDVLLTLDPASPGEPYAERFVGDEALARARIEDLSQGAGLRGAERGAFAAERAARIVAGPAG